MDIRLPLAATIVGRSRNTIMRWEARGYIEPQRDRLGRRVFCEADIARLRDLV
ncbi:MAG: MerR family transcriptional regulator [bacterium]